MNEDTLLYYYNTKKIPQPLKPEILKEFQKCHWTGILQIIKRMILLMTPMAKRNSIIRVKSKRNAILKRKDMMSLQVVLILFGVSHFIYIFGFFDVDPFVFHDSYPSRWGQVFILKG